MGAVEHGKFWTEVPDRAAVMDWIDANQLGRWNLKPDVIVD